MARGLYGLLIAALALAPAAVRAEDHNTGYIPLTPEAYARTPHAVRARSAVLLSRVDLSPYFPAPRDQGFQGSCTGWAVSYAARSYFLATLTGRKPVSDTEIASPAFVFNASTSKPDPKGVFCGGATLVDAIGVVVNRGSTSMAHFPYSQGSCLPAPGPDDIIAAQAWKVPGYESISGANLKNVDSYRELLERGRPVIIGVKFNHHEWLNIHGTGIYTLGPESTGTFANSGHAMVIVGYDDDKVAPNGDKGAFKIMNSWGIGWGDGGYTWASYTAMLTLIGEAYTFKDVLPPMIPREGVWAPVAAHAPVTKAPVTPASVIAPAPAPAPPPAVKPATSPQIVTPPTAVAPPPVTATAAPDIAPDLNALARGFKTGEVQVRKVADGYRLTGYGCVDEVQYLRAVVGKYGDRVSVVMDETPWPACEIRGILKDAVGRGGVAARVVNLAADAPPEARGIQITEDDAPVATTAILRNGDRFEIDAEVQDQAPYVQIFYLQADQSAKEIWRGEIKPDGDGRRRLSIGGANSKIKLTASRPYGTEAVLILAARGPVTPQTMEKNTSEVGFMDRLRSDLGAAVRANPDIRAQIVQVEVRDTTQVAAAWLVTPDELANFGPGEPLFGAGPVTALGDPWGPKIALASPLASDLAHLPGGRLGLQVMFKPSAGARVLPDTLRIEYRTAVGWRDITDRVRAQANINAAGLSSAPMGLPAGQHRLRLSLMDDRGRVGITELNLTTGN